jgi:hypothetical protein
MIGVIMRYFGTLPNAQHQATTLFMKSVFFQFARQRVRSEVAKMAAGSPAELGMACHASTSKQSCQRLDVLLSAGLSARRPQIFPSGRR